MSRTLNGFHFQPVLEQDLTQTDNAPLLFLSSPPSRKGRVTVFMKTRRTLRKRLGVHDPGQIEGVLQDREREIVHDELQNALSRRTQWRYLFPPESGLENVQESKVDSREFSSLLERTLAC